MQPISIIEKDRPHECIIPHDFHLGTRLCFNSRCPCPDQDFNRQGLFILLALYLRLHRLVWCVELFLEFQAVAAGLATHCAREVATRANVCLRSARRRPEWRDGPSRVRGAIPSGGMRCLSVGAKEAIVPRPANLQRPHGNGRLLLKITSRVSETAVPTGEPLLGPCS
jgi:hypothetical protein